jgi:hypothetical protein
VSAPITSCLGAIARSLAKTERAGYRIQTSGPGICPGPKETDLQVYFATCFFETLFETRLETLLVTRAAALVSSDL